MRNQLDMSNPIVTKEGKATAYMEDTMFGLFQAVNPTGINVEIIANVATVDLSKGSQFNILADDDFEIELIGVEDRADNDNVLDIENPAGAFDLTDITAPAGVTVYKAVGSTIAILGADYFSFEIRVPSNTKIQVIPQEMGPL